MSTINHTVTMPSELQGKTQELLIRFTEELARKLRKAELKHGYSDHWANPENVPAMHADMITHISKGDPRDVANFCMFLWHHNASTAHPVHQESIVAAMRQLTKEQRYDIISSFCTSCGHTDPNCVCWNDE